MQRYESHKKPAATLPHFYTCQQYQAKTLSIIDYRNWQRMGDRPARSDDAVAEIYSTSSRYSKPAQVCLSLLQLKPGNHDNRDRYGVCIESTKTHLRAPLYLRGCVFGLIRIYLTCQLHLIASILCSQSSKLHGNFSGTTLLSSLFEYRAWRSN